MKNIKVEGLFRNVKYPIELFDKNGNKIYFKNSEGYSWVQEFDGNNNKIYYKNSDGYSWVKEYDDNGDETYYKNSDGIVEDNRPKKKYTVKELEELTGIDNIEIIKE